MRPGQRSESFTPGEDWSWLGSAHATDTWESKTLDASSFTATFTDNIVPSGVVVSEDTPGGSLVVLGSGGGGKVGFLAVTKDISGGDTPAAIMWHGQVIVDNLPTDHGLDAAAAALMPLIDFVGVVPA